MKANDVKADGSGGQTLSVSEIFLSLQGEGAFAGYRCVLVRLCGCNLRCAWCDTQYALSPDQGSLMTIAEILKRADGFDCDLVEVTGGEPLHQSATNELLGCLCEDGYHVLLETNGSLDIEKVDPRVIKIVDFKCPSSGQSEHNLWANVEHLAHNDEVKFVIASRDDYDFAHRATVEHCLISRCEVIFTPADEQIDPAELAQWILADGLDVRLGLRLHRIVWPDKHRGV